jgi:hypothetical protein
MDMLAAYANLSGGLGVNDSMANGIKSLRRSQHINGHPTMIGMGGIPSVVAREVHIGVTSSPTLIRSQLATIQNATVAEKDSVEQAADAARTGSQTIFMKNAEIKAASSALAEIDDGKNRAIDINYIMTALDNYLKRAAEGTSGVPLNYYRKDISKSMLAKMWAALANTYPFPMTTLSQVNQQVNQKLGIPVRLSPR